MTGPFPGLRRFFPAALTCVLATISVAQSPTDTIENLVFKGTATCAPGFSSVCVVTSGPLTGSFNLDVTKGTIVGAWSFSTPFGAISSTDAGALTLIVDRDGDINPSFEVVTDTFDEFVQFFFPATDKAEVGSLATNVYSDACMNIPGGEDGYSACWPAYIVTGTMAPSWAATIKPATAGPLSGDGFPTTMYAKVTPTDANGNPVSLDTAAADLGFTGFNWQQHVKTLTAPSGMFPATPADVDKKSISGDGSLQAPPSFFDPPNGGGYKTDDGKADNAYPFYWNAGELANGLTPCGKSLGVPIETSVKLYFEDCPNIGAVTFTTSLVGVLPSGESSSPLFTWTWESTFNGDLDSGGVKQTKSYYPVLPGSGSGGVTLTSIYGVPVKATPTVKVTASINPTTYGKLLTLTAKVAGGAIRPTGKVTLKTGNMELGAVSLDDGEATLETHSLPAGSNSITASYAGDAHYVAAVSPALNVTVDKAALTVAANNAIRVYGAANPALTDTITGFMNGDSAAGAVTGAARLTTTATAASPVGSYPIDAAIGTLAAKNYEFKFKDGSLRVKAIGETAKPVFKPGSGAVAAGQSVTISDATTGAAIYYTLDGTTPTTSSSKYKNAIKVSAAETIEAIALAPGYFESAVASATYTIK